MIVVVVGIPESSARRLNWLRVLGLRVLSLRLTSPAPVASTTLIATIGLLSFTSGLIDAVVLCWLRAKNSVFLTAALISVLLGVWCVLLRRLRTISSATSTGAATTASPRRSLRLVLLLLFCRHNSIRQFVDGLVIQRLLYGFRCLGERRMHRSGRRVLPGRESPGIDAPVSRSLLFNNWIFGQQNASTVAAVAGYRERLKKTVPKTLSSELYQTQRSYLGDIVAGAVAPQ